jgi:hypothetical protein
MYRILFHRAFDDYLLSRLLAFMNPASSITKLGDASCGFKPNYTWVDYAKKGLILLKPLPLLHFSAVI